LEHADGKQEIDAPISPEKRKAHVGFMRYAIGESSNAMPTAGVQTRT